MSTSEINFLSSQIFVLTSILVIGSHAAPRSSSSSRERRSLGLMKLGLDLASGSGGFSSGVAAGVADSFSSLSTASKIGAGILVAKPLALALLGKCRLNH